MPWWVWLVLVLFMLMMIVSGIVYACLHGGRNGVILMIDLTKL